MNTKRQSRANAPLPTMRATEPFAPLRTQSAQDIAAIVPVQAGATLLRRDSLDTRIVEEVQTGTVRFSKKYARGGRGIIDGDRYSNVEEYFNLPVPSGNYGL